MTGFSAMSAGAITYMNSSSYDPNWNENDTQKKDWNLIERAVYEAAEMLGDAEHQLSKECRV